MSKLNAKQHIEVELNLDELDLTAAESKATYDEIKAYVLDKSSWVSFFQWLRGRGLDGVKLIVGDKCLGMLEAVGEVFPEASTSAVPSTFTAMYSRSRLAPR